MPRILCQAPDCERESWARGLCDMHIQRWRKGDNSLSVLPARRTYLEDRQLTCSDCGLVFAWVVRNNYAPQRCPDCTKARNRRKSSESHSTPEYRASRKAYYEQRMASRWGYLESRPCDVCSQPVGNRFTSKSKDGLLRCLSCRADIQRTQSPCSPRQGGRPEVSSASQ